MGAAGLPIQGNSLIMNLSMDSFWICKHLFDDAEEKYFSKQGLESVPIKEKADHKKKDDGDGKDNDDDKNNSNKQKNIKRTKNSENEEEVEPSYYNWTDESTYLSPNIPIMTPLPLTIYAPKDLTQCQVESNLSKNAKRLSTTIKEHMEHQTKYD